MELTLIPDYRGFLFIILPPGGFLVLGFLLAAKRILDQRIQQRQTARGEQPEQQPDAESVPA
jgi:electron transport complex protein RnfE